METQLLERRWMRLHTWCPASSVCLLAPPPALLHSSPPSTTIHTCSSSAISPTCSSSAHLHKVYFPFSLQSLNFIFTLIFQRHSCLHVTVLYNDFPCVQSSGGCNYTSPLLPTGPPSPYCSRHVWIHFLPATTGPLWADQSVIITLWYKEPDSWLQCFRGDDSKLFCK